MEVGEEVLAAVKAAAQDNRLTCAAAQELARRLEVPMLVVGAAANRLGVRIRQCQLGCFK